MSTWSAFGFSGIDPIGTAGEQMNNFSWNGKDLRRNVRYQKKMMRFQQSLNQQNALWNAANMPKAQVAGYRAAGINPIAAYGQLGNVGAGDVSQSTIAGGQSAAPFGDGGFDMNAFASAKAAHRTQKQESEQRDANIDKTKEETDATKKNAEANLIQAEAARTQAGVNAAKQSSEIARNYGAPASTGLGALGMLLGLRRMGNIKNSVNELMKKGIPLNMNKAEPTPPGFIVPPGITKPPIDKSGPTTLGNSAKNAAPGFMAALGRFSLPAAASSLAALGYVGSQYYLGKHIEENMTEAEKKAFDKIRPARQKHENQSMFKKYEKPNRRHN